MIIEQARVKRSEGSTVWVETSKASVCGGCQAKSGCGQSLLQRYLGRSSAVEAKVPATFAAPLDPGDQVEIGIAEHAVLAGSLISYGIPVAALIGAIIFSEWLLPELTVLFGLLGLAGGFYLARFVLRSFFSADQFTPVVLKRVSDIAPLSLGEVSRATE